MKKETIAYLNSQWRDRALRFARSLHGREYTPTEQGVYERQGPDGLFRTFGLQPETQGYIDTTIHFIECMDMEDYGMQLVYEVRLKWSAEELGCGKYKHAKKIKNIRYGNHNHLYLNTIYGMTDPRAR